MKKWYRIVLISFLLSMLTLLIWVLPLNILGNTFQDIAAIIEIPISVCAAISWLWAMLERRKSIITDRTKIEKINNPNIHIDKSNIKVKNPNNVTIVNLPIEELKNIPSLLQKRNTNNDIEIYNQLIKNLYKYIEFKGMGINDRVPLTIPLLDLYVPLHARLEIPEFEKAEKSKVDNSLNELITDKNDDISVKQHSIKKIRSENIIQYLQEYKDLVVLGDPGSGKSTLLKWLALIMVSGQANSFGLNNYLPILLSLSSYAKEIETGNDCPLDGFLSIRFENLISSIFSVKEIYKKKLEDGKALILLDGLDEIGDVNLRQRVFSRVKNFHALHSIQGNRFVLTSRIIGYKEVQNIGIELQIVTLEDFNDNQIYEFVTKWTKHIEKILQEESIIAETLATNERDELLFTINQNQSVRKLAVNPLLLTILCSMNRQGVLLPERRVQLYDKYISVLLTQWNQARNIDGIKPGRNLNTVQIMRLLPPIALWMHEHSFGMGHVKINELRNKLKLLFLENGEMNPEEATDQFLKDVRDYSCLLIQRSTGEYGFLHLTFEEYLAGVGIADLYQGDEFAIADHICQTIDDSLWDEINKLALAYLTLIQNLYKRAGAVIEIIIKRKPGIFGKAIIFAGEVIADIGKDALPVKTNKLVINELIENLQNDEVYPEIRSKCGEVLSNLGWLPNDLDQFLKVSAGKFYYGNQKDRRKLTLQYIDYNFWIGKYPVTNLQFHRFIDDNGYQNLGYWSENGKKWLNKKVRDKPLFLSDSKFNLALQPVVGINWYEAEAYCNWLTQTQIGTFDTDYGVQRVPKGYIARLPKEVEWEFAARGDDGRFFPWGDDFLFSYSNTLESNINSPTIVTMYSSGVSPFNIWDMIGNVWEWQIDEVSPGKSIGRKVRGGSWYVYNSYANCAINDWLYAESAYNNFGFRVVISKE